MIYYKVTGVDHDGYCSNEDGKDYNEFKKYYKQKYNHYK